jgi:hypothetical protein
MKRFVLIILIFSCSSKETAQQKAETAVKKYIKQNANDASSYKPVAFGKLDTVYTNDSGSYWQLDVTRKNIVAQFNVAKNKGLETVADSLRGELEKINNKMDAGKTFSGLKIYHISQGKNELGEMVMNRGSFYLDSNFVVKKYIMTEDSLMTEEQNTEFD